MISVIIPTYNTPNIFLKQCVRSVLDQTYDCFEIIIVDDGSREPFSGIRNEINDRRIKWINCEKNSGVSVARNIGVSHAIGEWIAFLDADDWWTPNKLELQLNIAIKENVQWVYASAYLTTQEGRVVTQLYAEKKGKVFNDLLREMIVIGSTSAVLVEKALFIASGGFDTDKDLVEDWDMWLRLAKLAQVSFVIEPLVYLRSYGKNSRSAQLKAKLRRVINLQERYSDDLLKVGLGRYAKAHLCYVAARQYFISGYTLRSIFFILKGVMLSPSYYHPLKLLSWLRNILIYQQ